MPNQELSWLSSQGRSSCKSHDCGPIFARLHASGERPPINGFSSIYRVPGSFSGDYRLCLWIPVATVVAVVESRLTAVPGTGESIWRRDPAARARSESVGAVADRVKLKPNDFLDTPWKGSRERTHSAGR